MSGYQIGGFIEHLGVGSVPFPLSNVFSLVFKDVTVKIANTFSENWGKVSHLPSFENIVSSFFSISLSSFRSAFSRSNCRIRASVSVSLPFPGNVSSFLGCLFKFSFHSHNNPNVIPNSRSTSDTVRSPFSYIRMASNLDSFLYFLRAVVMAFLQF